MVRVAVVGGGTAGIEAARAASAYGAEVTIIERSENPEPPGGAWVDLLTASCAFTAVAKDYQRSLWGSTIIGEVRSVLRGKISLANGATISSDVVILTTGSRFEPVTLQGWDKRGVIVLDKFWKYMELGTIATSSAKSILWGEGERSLEVADRLAKMGNKVTIGISHWRNGRPSTAVESIIRESAGQAGVGMTEGNLQRALGVGTLEAVLIDGRVRSCDALAIVPPRHPSLPPTDAALGHEGRVLVDRCLRSSSPEIMAAGASAEVSSGIPAFSSLEAEAQTSGSIAGANAAGQRRTVKSTRFVEGIAFGFRWSRAGLCISRAIPNLSGFATAGQRLESSACAIVYQRRTGKVFGIEIVDRVGERSGDIRTPVSEGQTLECLAYGGSTDISLVSETARIGLRNWSRS